MSIKNFFRNKMGIKIKLYKQLVRTIYIYIIYRYKNLDLVKFLNCLALIF